MDAMAAASGVSMTFVASNRPPRPTSSTTKSQSSLREPIERERGDELELRDGIACGFKLVRNGRHALYFFDELRLGDHFAVDAKALAKIEHIRGRVEARAVACRRKHARDKRAGGALAIRAGYMDKTRLLLRIAELFAERFNALQPPA